MKSTGKRLVAVFLVPLLGVMAAGGLAWAETDLTVDLATLKKDVAEQKRAGDNAALIALVKKGVKLHRKADGDEKFQKKVVDVIGSVTKASKDKDVVIAALDGLAQTRNPHAAKYVKPYLKQTNASKAPAMLRAAVKAAAYVPGDALVSPLLKIVEKSKTFAVAAEAMNSLGSFKESKRKRADILERLIKTTAKSKPGVKGNEKGYVQGDQYRHSGEATRNRWQSLAPVLPSALARLTGQDIPSATADTWIDMLDDYKGKLGSLFVDD